MKLASLVVRLANGKLAGLFGDAVQPLLDAARTVRESGEFEGQPAIGGAVLAAHRVGPVTTFRCQPQVEAPKVSSKRK